MTNTPNTCSAVVADEASGAGALAPAPGWMPAKVPKGAYLWMTDGYEFRDLEGMTERNRAALHNRAQRRWDAMRVAIAEQDGAGV